MLPTSRLLAVGTILPQVFMAAAQTSSKSVISSSSLSMATLSTLTATPTPSSASSSASSTASSGTASVPVPSTAPGPDPFTPAGGAGTNSSVLPEYIPMSDFDFQSLNLALNQEWIELDLFQQGLAQFTVDEFEAAGLNVEDRFLIEFMAQQEVGHATMLSNILGPHGAKQCNYTYPFQTVPEFINFCQKLTRFGESGVYGFLPHLNSRPASQLLLQSITTEARQQMIFRQFEGLFPMPVWFEVGVPQAFAWTLLSPYLTSCPEENPHIVFQIFPTLNVTNNPNATDPMASPAITHNRTIPLTTPNQTVYFTWDEPGKVTGYDGKYTTNSTAGEPKFAAWINQLNVTYTPLTNISNNSAQTLQPDVNVYGPDSAALINGTVFIVITDDDLPLTPFNLTSINPHVVAGPVLYLSG